MNRIACIRSAGALVALAALTGCGLQGPTYGTGKAANVQLLEDVASIVDLAPDKGEPIAYQPRPELVVPPAGAEGAALPPPQQSATESAGWVESPEERRKRYRDYATANRDEPGFQPVVATPDDYSAQSADVRRTQEIIRSRGGIPPAEATAEQRAEYQRRKRLSTVGDADQRRYLSEPPTDYRVPASTAPTDDLGEDEKEKAARLAKEAGVKKKKFIFF